MSQQPANADFSLEEQLVAYLDGELEPDASRRIEGLLAADPKVRHVLQGLDRTWELLDELDKPQIADQFTQSTLEMVTVAAAGDSERSRTEASRRRRWSVALFSGSLLVALAAGFLVVSSKPDPNQELIDNLPLLEILDEYRQIDNIEFLQMLYEEGVFDTEISDE
jgi:anti-sigma factor RsiW